MKNTKRILLAIAFTLLVAMASAKEQKKEGRASIDLSSLVWSVRLDPEAQWRDDTLYLPSEVELGKLPVNRPSYGWDNLYQSKQVQSSLPLSIEQLFSKGVNSYTYRGVSWLCTEVEIPKDWKGRFISFDVEKARMRMEIYINEQLAGYDLIAETPYTVNVADKLRYGKKNRIAIRLTNPGGQRGWADFPGIGWKRYRFPASHDFSGVGHITLEAKDQTHLSDLFLKTLSPVSNKEIELQATIENNSGKALQPKMRLQVFDASTGQCIHTENWTQAIADGTNLLTRKLRLEGAKPWDLDHPHLYRCKVSLVDAEHSDEYAVRFGVRTVEVKNRGGNPSFYLNGKRVRLRSAIDWGYYAHTGFYATPEQAKKSVDAALEVGHNMISFHRRIGEPEVLNYADEKGLYLYEEPGGFRANGQGDCVPEGTFTEAVMLEKIRRMVLRDRNHPSLIWYTLANEDPSINPARRKALHMVNDLDNSRFIANSSGWGKIESILPYSSTITNNFVDDHTVEEHKASIPNRMPSYWREELEVYNNLLAETEKRDRTTESESRFRETDFHSHQKQNDSCLVYWGEVRCFTGPPNWVEAANMQRRKNDQGYDMNIYKPMADKLEAFYQNHNFASTGSGTITSAADLSRQAGKGLMYIDGRLEQILLASDLNDGYAINGWSSGPQLPLNWESAILDEARNCKGPAEELAYWNRTKQVAIFRQNGKYFQVGDTAVFRLHLINEDQIEKGYYQLELSVLDGDGTVVKEVPSRTIEVLGGDIYAQELQKQLSIVPEQDWKAGYITLVAELYNGKELVCEGKEQVLLQNRPSYFNDLKGRKGLVYKWRQAEKAIKETGADIQPYSLQAERVDYLLAGGIVENNYGLFYYGPVRTTPPPTFSLSQEETKDVLRRVREDGTTLLLNFNEKWATWLFENGLLSDVPLAFSHDQKTQTKFWDGNGWGYIDHFCGNQSIPAGRTIGTTSWEVPSNPKGFFPFESEFPTKVYGAYFENGGKIRVLIGEIDYGKGKVLLSRTYNVNANHAFNDMLFYNMITMR